MRSTAVIAFAAAVLSTPAAEPRKNSLDLAALPAPVTGQIEFGRDIQPLFAKHCISCHGPEKHKAGLRLDVREDALRGSDSGPVISPAKSAESLLIHNVAGLDPDYVMPPEGEGDRLTPDE